MIDLLQANLMHDLPTGWTDRQVVGRLGAAWRLRCRVGDDKTSNCMFQPAVLENPVLYR